MKHSLTIFLNIVLTLVWFALAILVIGYPTAIGLRSWTSPHHLAFVIGFAVCLLPNIWFLWFKPKSISALVLIDRVVLAATMICIWGLI